jgi:hypothetical protein
MTHSPADEINARVNLEDLALRLGLERPGDRGNFKNPHTESRHSPTLSVFAGRNGDGRWYDHRTGEGGRAIDLYILARGCDFATALRELGEMYGIRTERERRGAEPPRERTRAEWIADKCLDAVRGAGSPGRQAVMDYLVGQRKLAEHVVAHALDKGALGFNDYRSAKVPAGEAGHGGPGVAFIVRRPALGGSGAADSGFGQVLAVETRYLDPALNGKQKTATQGDKHGAPWCSDWRRFAAAKKVVVVESAINAMTVESADPGVAAVSTQGAGNVRNMDWRIFRDKTVILGFDNDEPETQGALAGYCPGTYWAWKAHESLVALDVPVLMLETDDWLDDEKEPVNDLNDLLQLRGPDGVHACLRKLETWLVPGLAGKAARGKPRLWLPAHDFAVYWRFRVREDFTAYVDKYSTDDDGKEKLDFSNVAGFRVAGLSRVTIASPTATMTGDRDLSPVTVFAISVQVPRYSHRLQRRVVNDEQLHNVEVWKKLGPIYSAPNFLRMVNILERGADIGARSAVNFVGLAWRDSRLIVNEGPDCFFSDPRQQCPYANLVFPSGAASQARDVLQAYQGTFRSNEALLMLVWALGAHLKAFLGFWPHFVCQAEKGSGKTTLIKHLERTIGMTMFSGQSLNTEFRILTSLSCTSHPVGWEEISARKQELINKAVSNLQECYQYSHTRRGADLIDFLLCAPVLLAGEDVPVAGLTGKLVRNDLTKAKRGPRMSDDVPRFPVRQWLEHLATLQKARVLELHAEACAAMTVSSSARADDAGAERMLGNYGAIRLAWRLLCEWAGADLSQGDFLRDLTATMNAHITETASDRQPWVWIVDKLLSEIARGQFKFPFAFDTEDEEPVLCVRSSHVMDHLRSEHSLREFWDGLPVKSDRVFKKALLSANVVVRDSVERTVHGKRVSHMMALSLPALEQYGLWAVQPAASAAESPAP